jgi:hypothetical protein
LQEVTRHGGIIDVKTMIMNGVCRCNSGHEASASEERRNEKHDGQDEKNKYQTRPRRGTEPSGKWEYEPHYIKPLSIEMLSELPYRALADG